MDPTFKGLSVPAPTTASSRGLNIRKGLMIGVGLIVLIALVSFTVSLLAPNNTALSQRLLFRLDALDSLMSTAQPNIKDNAVGKINADLSLILAGDISTLKKIIPTVKITKELSAIKTEEDDTANTKKLSDALLNATYDSTFKAVFLEKLNQTYLLANELAGKTSSNSLKNALDKLNEHLTTYYNQLKALK